LQIIYEMRCPVIAAMVARPFVPLVRDVLVEQHLVHFRGPGYPEVILQPDVYPDF